MPPLRGADINMLFHQAKSGSTLSRVGARKGIWWKKNNPNKTVPIN